MVILLKQHAPQAEQERLLAWLRELGAEVRITGTPERPFFCLTGDISRIDPSLAARFPAVEDDLDNVLGVLHAKDLLKLLIDPKVDPKTLLRPARFIPESQPLNVLLRDFKTTRSHLALVIDEFGSISGLITIEDVLEQIVGDISDEFDHDDSKTNIVADDRWRVKALTPIDQFNNYFGSQLVDNYCDTIGGLVTDRFEHVPKVGEVIEEKGFRFCIEEGDERQVEVLSVEQI